MPPGALFIFLLCAHLPRPAPQFLFASHAYCCRPEQHGGEQQSPAAGQQQAAAPAPSPRPQGAAEPGGSKELGRERELQQSGGVGGADEQAAVAADDKPEHPAK